jgi:hypothetical protein
MHYNKLRSTEYSCLKVQKYFFRLQKKIFKNEQILMLRLRTYI